MMGSQPGESELDFQQQAWVEGYTLKPTAKILDRLGLYSDLIVFTFSPGKGGGHLWSATAIKAAISQVRSIWSACKPEPFRSAWTAKAEHWTTSSRSACGGR